MKNLPFGLVLSWLVFFRLNFAPGILSGAEDDSWTSDDKFLHFGASFAIDTASYWSAREGLHYTQPQALAVAAGVTLAAGIIKEYSDEKFDFKDMTWNAAGLAVSSCLWWFADRRQQPSSAMGIIFTPTSAGGIYVRKF